MNRECELRLKCIKSARPVHIIPGAYVRAAAKRLQQAAVFIFYEQITTETKGTLIGNGTGGAGDPLIAAAVYFCLIFSIHSHQ